MFLEGLRPFNTVGKLKNLRLDPADIAAHAAGRQLQGELHDFAALLRDLHSASQRQVPQGVSVRFGMLAGESRDLTSQSAVPIIPISQSAVTLTHDYRSNNDAGTRTWHCRRTW